MLVGIVTLFTLSLACVVSAQNCNPNYGFVKVTQRSQETGQWCWAATQQMVMESHGDQYSMSQCLLVTEILRGQRKISSNVRSCCDPEYMLDPVCSRPNWPDFPRKNFHSTITKPIRSAQGLSWEEITNQICHGHPVVITLEFNQSAHQYVVAGYLVMNNGKRLIYVHDPLGTDDNDPNTTVDRWKSFQHFYAEAWGGQAKHSSDFIEICPNGSMKDGKCE